jgi:hydroxymethylglutaryl-CoA synthase
MSVGIVGYGVYVPRQRIATEEIVKVRESKRKDLNELIEKIRYGLLLKNKAIADFSEDTITMATEAAENAVLMAGIDPSVIGSVTVGTESKPYAVGSTARHAASFIGVKSNVYVTDLEGACNAGMQGLEIIKDQILSGEIEYGLAIGSDVAQAPEGDPLEYACGAGAAAFILGKKDTLAIIKDMAPYSSLTMDFWRREESPVPKHFGKTTVEAYITHVIGAIINLLRKNRNLTLSNFDHITFHQPSGYMPLKTCKTLLNPASLISDKELAERVKLTQEDIEKKVTPWLKVLEVGNTYAASTLIGLASILDKANPGDNILAVSYGSGAYSIATWIKVEDKIKEKVGVVPTVDDYINRRKELNFQKYKENIKERLARIKRRLIYPRIIGEIQPLEKEAIEVTLCDGCKRIYYPPREKCLEFECKGPVMNKIFPRRALLKSFRKLTSKERFTLNYSIIKDEKVLLVDCDLEELKENMELELIIRRLDYEGEDGLIIYGPTYRPAFRRIVYPYQPLFIRV